MMAPPDRELRIDFLRGLALIFIFIDHVRANVLSRFTPRAFGFSNAADVFVLLGDCRLDSRTGPAAHKKGIRAILPRLLRRIAQLYSAHLALLWISIGLTAAATLVFNKPEFMERAVPVLVQSDLLTGAWSSLPLILQPRYRQATLVSSPILLGCSLISPITR